MAIGSFNFVLHSHLPYCRKAGVWPFGEEWVMEALAETYLPVLNVLNDLKARGLPVRITVGLTPVLVEQLADPYMLGRFEQYLDDKIKRAEGDIGRFAELNEFKMKELARFYRDYYAVIKRSFTERYRRDIVGAFKDLQDSGEIEIITSAATHAYLPLLSTEESIYAQLKIGIDSYVRHFGRRPRGAWLPECAYRPRRSQPQSQSNLESQPRPEFKRGIESFLEELGIEYFFVDSHAIEGGRAFSQYTKVGPVDLAEGMGDETQQERERTGKTTFLPYYLEGSTVVAFGRNERTGLQVWSSEWGYPGDGNYREFHRRDPESGFQYWKVTSHLVDLDGKELYSVEGARGRVEEHSSHFTWLVEQLLAEFHQETGRHGILVAPYDIELFGHWWFEGVEWLGRVLEKMAQNPAIELTTTGGYLSTHPPDQTIELHESSWGLGGKHYIWANSDTEWMWRDIHAVEEKMRDLARMFAEVSPTVAPAGMDLLRQAAREALLLQSSDWPFLITTQGAREYATKRFTEHRERFWKLAGMVESGLVLGGEFELGAELGELGPGPETDVLFPDIDPMAFLGLKPGGTPQSLSKKSHQGHISP
ncbi:MAG TPA: DUF1957 domain-containing protein [Firmicutes bacterium]|nr:DUF1957 domain-containing protein [Bacillota bacterium]